MSTHTNAGIDQKNEKQFLAFLNRKIANDDSDLVKDVARIIVTECNEQPVDYVTSICYHGCISGWVTALTWYNQTNAFYDMHYDEIEELREELEDSFGQPITIKSPLKNFFAWLAFEEISYCLALEFGLEI